MIGADHQWYCIKPGEGLESPDVRREWEKKREEFTSIDPSQCVCDKRSWMQCREPMASNRHKTHSNWMLFYTVDRKANPSENQIDHLWSKKEHHFC